MFYDALSLRAFVRELVECYPLPWFVQKVSQIDDTDYLLRCRGSQPEGSSLDRNFSFLISLRPGAPAWSLWSSERPAARVPSSFTMLFRKLLQGRPLLRVEALYPERAVAFSGYEGSVIVELLERQPNLLLLDDTGHIRGGHRLGKGERDLRPRRAYVPPPRESLPAADQLGYTDVKEAFEAPGWPANLLERCIGLSPAACRQLDSSEAGWWDSWKSMWERTEPGNYHAERLENGRLSIWGQGQPLPLLELAAPQGQPLPGLEARRQQASKALSQRRKKLAVRLTRLEQDREKVGEADRLQREGELLLTYQSQVAPGASSVELLDWDGVTPVKIQLDTTQTLTAQARGRLKRAAKYRRSLPIVEERLVATRIELDAIDEMAHQVERAESAADLDDLQGPSVKHVKASPGSRRTLPGSGPRRYQLGDYQMLVGRSPRQNDLLVQKYSKREDLWFHVKDSPGAHVVLKTGGRSPEPEVVEAAAVLAAHYSSRAQDAQVLVSFTSSRRVRKPAGSPAGFVVYTEELTLWVRPERRPPGLQRLS